MTEINIQAVLADQAAHHIVRRKVFAIGWVQVKPARQNDHPAGAIGNLKVLGVVVVEDELGSEQVPADLR